MKRSANIKRQKYYFSRGVTTLLAVGFIGVLTIVMGTIASYVLTQGKYGRALFARRSRRKTEIGAAAREHRTEARPGGALAAHHVDVHVACMA